MSISILQNEVGVIGGAKYYRITLETSADFSISAATAAVVKKLDIVVSYNEVIKAISYTTTAGGTGAKVSLNLIEQYTEGLTPTALTGDIDISAAVATPTSEQFISHFQTIGEFVPANQEAKNLGLSFSGANIPVGFKLVLWLETVILRPI